MALLYHRLLHPLILRFDSIRLTIYATMMPGTVGSAAEEPPALRPIETPTNDDDGQTASSSGGSSGYFFASSSPTSPPGAGVVWPSSSSYGSPEEYVLPRHSGSGGAGSARTHNNGTMFRRIRTSLLSSPAFHSPLAKRVMSGGGDLEENILVQTTKGGFGGRKRGRRSGGTSAVGGGGYRNSSAGLAAVCLVGAAALTGVWFLSSSGKGSRDRRNANTSISSPSSSAATTAAAAVAPRKSIFTFRPDPVEGTPSADAIDLYRQAYGTTGEADIDLPYVGMDDPMNPGSIFVVLDLVEDVVGENGERKPSNTLVHPDSPLFGGMDSFDKGLRQHLMEKFPTATNDDDGPAQMIDVTSYYSVLAEGLPHIAGSQFATPDGYTTLTEVKFAVPGKDAQSHDDINSYSRRVVRTIESFVHENLPRQVEAQFTGLPLFRMDLRSADGQSGRPSLVGASLDDILPPSSPSLHAYHHLASRFGHGVISPYKIVFDHSDDEKSIDTDPGFRLMHKVMVEFAQVDLENETREEEAEEEMETIAGLAAVNLDSIPQRIEDGQMAEHLTEVMDELYGPSPIADSTGRGGEGVGRRDSKPLARTVYNGIPILRNNQVPYPLYLGARICREKQHHHCNLELLHHFTAMRDVMTSSDRMTTYVLATLGVDPFSKYGLAWLMAARMKIREMERNGDLGGYRVNIVGGAALEYDAWFSSPTTGSPQNGGGGEEPPSTIGDDSEKSSFKFFHLLLPISFVFVALGLRSVLGARSKQYGHKKF